MDVGGSGSVVGIFQGLDGVLTENEGANDISPQDAGNLSDQKGKWDKLQSANGNRTR